MRHVFRTRALFLLIIIFSGTAAAAGTTDERTPHRTPVYTEAGSAACLRCHSGDKMRAIAASPHGDAGIPGSPESARGCESCHGPGSIHISRAHGGRGFPPLTGFGRGTGASPREEQLHACLSCHAGDSSGTPDIGFIGSVHDRRTINCSTCHTVHSEADPVSDRETQTATCRRCHRRQVDEHPRFEDKSINFAALSCATCHDPHLPARLAD